MRLYEHEVKDLLAGAGLAAPRGELARDPAEARRIAAELGGPVVVKAQSLVKARGKAGLIGFADTPEEAAGLAESLLGREHQGEKISALLVEEKVSLSGELYLGVAVDYTACRPLVLASRAGGVEIEQTARENPDQILRVPVSPSQGLGPAQAGEVAAFLAQGQPPELGRSLARAVEAVYHLFVERDLEMLEVNPLGLVDGRNVVAVDGAAALDGDALFRQPDLVKPRNQSPGEFEREQDFRRRGWSYLRFEGDIGILSSGAGITMAILDMMRLRGGKPANFLDTAQMDRKGIYDAFQIFLNDPSIKTVLVNIFAGLNRCDHLAQGIKDFLQEFHPGFRVVVRMAGNREQEGSAILAEIGVETIRELERAVDKAIAVTEGPR